VDSQTDDAGARLQRIRYAMRSSRWWEARGLLAHSLEDRDWQALGYASWEDYLSTALDLERRTQQPRAMSVPGVPLSPAVPPRHPGRE
jgi:hypothetical protein